MFKRSLHSTLRRLEKQNGVGFDHCRKMIDASPAMFQRFNKIFDFLNPNTELPARIYHVARIVAAHSLGCGTSVQGEINLALEAKVPAYIIRDVLERNVEELDSSIRAVFRLNDAIREQRDDPEVRKSLLQTFGEAGYLELLFAIQGAAMLVSIKRGMGYAEACDIEGLRIDTKKAGAS